jgi:hypothetical protein
MFLVIALVESVVKNTIGYNISIVTFLVLIRITMSIAWSVASRFLISYTTTPIDDRLKTYVNIGFNPKTILISSQI